MKKVLILFGKRSWNTESLFNNKQYQDSYEVFYSLCKKNDIEMYGASYDWYNYENNIFKYAWTFNEIS